MSKGRTKCLVHYEEAQFCPKCLSAALESHSFHIETLKGYARRFYKADGSWDYMRSDTDVIRKRIESAGEIVRMYNTLLSIIEECNGSAPTPFVEKIKSLAEDGMGGKTKP